MPKLARRIMTTSRIWVTVMSLSALIAMGLIAIGNNHERQINAQQQVPPTLPAIIFHGKVTINGEEPLYSGFTITARIGDTWESAPVIVGGTTADPFKYTHLVVAPPLEEDLFGSEIQFWLEGQVVSEVTSFYAQINEFSGEVCGGCTWTFPFLREVNLDFSSLPQATPTITPTLTPSPVILAPAFFSGPARSPSGALPDGTQVYAVVGDDFRTGNVQVFNGQYFLTVDVVDEMYLNARVVFFAIDDNDPSGATRLVQAISAPGAFVPGAQFQNFSLIFPELLPTLTPTPLATETPTETPSPIPTETATATPSPTPTLTPSPSPTATVTPTPSPSPTATVTATATPTPMSVPPTPTPTVAPTAAPSPRPSPPPSPTATTEAPEATSTPEPTRTPRPTIAIEAPTNTPVSLPPTPTQFVPTPIQTSTPTPAAETGNSGFCSAAPNQNGSMEATLPLSIVALLSVFAWRITTRRRADIEPEDAEPHPRERKH